MAGRPCSTCDGKRLKRQALSVTFAGLDIGGLSGLSLNGVAKLLRPVALGNFDDRKLRRTSRLSEEKRLAAQRLAHDLVERIDTLRQLGLGYLSLDRSTPTLSPGELQRLRLAMQIRSNLFGVVYVLDEPTARLHPADVDKLMRQLQGLLDAGNTVLVVEHEMRVVADSDWVIDIGPGAGETGGRIIAAGPPAEVCKAAAGRTAPHLRRALGLV